MIVTKVRKFTYDEGGQSMVEYTLIIVLIAIFLLGTFALLSGNMTNVLDYLSQNI